MGMSCIHGSDYVFDKISHIQGDHASKSHSLPRRFLSILLGLFKVRDEMVDLCMVQPGLMLDTYV